ncbi:unnamed protein product [Rhizoctonia solani]|uniref:Uncharacterized protein n=1 Tax=Rhizoctonia solani TaxID=456999 RepID=A0A8H3GNR7_9AGAM|nr:unnamed protein product [Rhizoctonia solani]
MWREEGWRGMMAGNGINCLRIVPYSAVQFTTYEQLKKLFTANGTLPLDTPTRLLVGALAGINSVTTTYLLDLVRSRLSVASASIRVPTPTMAPAPALVPSPAPSPIPSGLGQVISAQGRRTTATLLQHPPPRFLPSNEDYMSQTRQWFDQVSQSATSTVFFWMAPNLHFPMAETAGSKPSQAAFSGLCYYSHLSARTQPRPQGRQIVPAVAQACSAFPQFQIELQVSQPHTQGAMSRHTAVTEAASFNTRADAT